MKTRPHRTAMCPLSGLATLLLTVASAVSLAAADGCIPGLRMIAARGTLEAPGTGIIGTVADAVAAAVPNSTVVGLGYPATYRDYTVSEAAGVAAVFAAVGEYVGNCSSAKIALLGYSQVRADGPSH